MANATRNEQLKEVMERAVMARGIKGAPIPRDLIDKIADLYTSSDYEEYNFVIGSSSSLSRTKRFFWEYQNTLKFYDEHGKEFELDDDTEVVTQNEVFMAISFDKSSKEAHVYMYFPYDGAYI